MGYKITVDNVDEWCFRYLENDLSNAENAFFRGALEFNPMVQGEFEIWNKTTVNSVSQVYVSPSISENIINKTSSSETWLWKAGFGIMALLAGVLLVFTWNFENTETKPVFKEEIKHQDPRAKVVDQREEILEVGVKEATSTKKWNSPKVIPTEINLIKSEISIPKTDKQRDFLLTKDKTIIITKDSVEQTVLINDSIHFPEVLHKSISKEEGPKKEKQKKKRKKKERKIIFTHDQL